VFEAGPTMKTADPRAASGNVSTVAGWQLKSSTTDIPHGSVTASDAFQGGGHLGLP